MIVSCPACSARYRIPEAKIKGRGAKITCPKCAHVFVVYKDEAGASSPPAPDRAPAVAERDFHGVGVHWKVRKASGLVLDVGDLAALRQLMAEGRVGRTDQISHDGRDWRPLGGIADLDRHFADIWERARRGELPAAPAVIGDAGDEDDEDESDAPTTIVSQGSTLADEIRKAVKQASTPPTTLERDASALIGSPLVDPATRSAAAAGEPFKGLKPRRDADTGLSPAVVVATLIALVLLGVAGAFGLGLVSVGPDGPSSPTADAPRSEGPDGAASEAVE